MVYAQSAFLYSSYFKHYLIKCANVACMNSVTEYFNFIKLYQRYALINENISAAFGIIKLQWQSFFDNIAIFL